MNALPNWRINGQGRMRKPAHLELYPICSSCADDLKAIHKEKLESPDQNGTFIADVQVVHEHLSDLQRKIDKCLPNYRQAVDALICRASSIEKVIKLHLDICCMLPVVKRTIDIHQLSLCPQSPTQKKLHKRILDCTYRRYEEHRYQYCYTRKQLFQQISALDQGVPSKSDEECEQYLISTQKALSQQSIESVYIEISQLINDLSRNHFDLDSIVLERMMKIIQSIKEELSLFLDGENWEEHFKMPRESRIINVIEYLKGDQNATVRFSSIIQQCSIILHGCCCQLQTDTLDQEFPQTKRLLQETDMKLESLV